VGYIEIIPDDKDWTWVISQPCPECGFDAQSVKKEDAPIIVGQIADAWTKVLLREDVRHRPNESTWSALEYGCHVRDVFRIFNYRVNLMIATDGAQFENWDQDATARDEQYERQDPDVVSEELNAAAQTIAATYRGVSGDLWGHRGLRSNGSEFTIATQVVYLLHDPIHHLWDVGVDFEISND